jgi:hypothetical protein
MAKFIKRGTLLPETVSEVILASAENRRTFLKVPIFPFFSCKKGGEHTKIVLQCIISLPFKVKP